MFCIKCGKPFDGEGYLCPDCLAAQAPQAAPAVSEGPSVQELAAPEVPAAPQYIPPQQPPYVPPQAPQYAPPQTPQYAAPYAPTYQQPQYTAPQQPQYAPPQQPAFTPGFTLSTPVEAPKKKTGLIIGILVLILALVGGGVALALNWDKLFGGEKLQIPEDPSEYVAFLEEPRMQAISQDLSRAYGQWLSSGQAGMSLEGRLNLHIGEDILLILGQQLAQQGMEIDLNWLQDISLNLSANAQPDGKAADFSLGLGLGDTHLLSLNGAMDLGDMILYLAVPELNKQSLQMDLSLAMNEAGVDMEAMTALSQQLVKDMPSQEDMAGFLDGGCQILLRYLSDAEKQTQELTVGDAQQEVTVLTVKLTEKQLAQLLQELVQYVKDSNTAQQIYKAYMNYAQGLAQMTGSQIPMSMEDYDAFFQEGIDTFQEAIDEAEPENFLLLSTFVDGNTVLGRQITSYNEDGPFMDLFFAALTEDATTYLEAKFSGEDTIQLSFSGEGVTKGDKFSGEFLLKAQDDGQKYEYFTLELTDVTASGCGTYTLTPSAQLMEEMDLEGLVSTLASNLALQLEVREDGAKLSILVGKTTLLSLDGSFAAGDGKKVSFPKDALDAMDQQALMQWVSGMDFGGVIQSLKDAGLPKELTDALDQLLQMINVQIN